MPTKKSKKVRSLPEKNRAPQPTELREVVDLQSALRSLTLRGSSERAKQFHETVISLSATLDPNSVTMTSTNVPDAITKLASVIRQMSDASHKVFGLVERQGAVKLELATLISTFEARATSGNLGPEEARAFINQHKALCSQLEELGHEIIMAHEFQDLCGQSVSKAKSLLEGIDRNLRALLPFLGITPAATESQSESNPDLDQAAMDAILRQLTSW